MKKSICDLGVRGFYCRLNMAENYIYFAAFSKSDIEFARG